MPELDDLLTGRVSDAAAERAATPPPFRDLRARGIRRRRKHRAGAMGAAVAAVVVVVAGIQLAGLDRPSQPVDVPRPTPTPPATPDERLTASEVVDHPDARLQRVVVAPGAPDTRAALWQVCRNDDCTRASQALAVTGDRFQTRAEMAIPHNAYPLVTALGPDGFYVAWNRRNQLVIRTDGSTVEAVADPAPLRDGDVLVRTPSLRFPFAGVHPETGEIHPLPVPEGMMQLVQQPDGTLAGTLHAGQPGSAAALWSTDGGNTWQEQTLRTHEHPLMSMVPSARPQVLALIEGADGATLFPLLEAHRSLDGGRTWQSYAFSDRPRAYGGAGAVLPDGRLLLDVQAWSDQRANRPSALPVGLYISDGSDWSDLSPVTVGAPFSSGDSEESDLQLLDRQVTAEGVALYARRIEDGALGNTVYVSYDAGSSWQEVEAR